MNIPDEAAMAAYDALCAIYWPDTQTHDVATADLDTVSETVYTVLEAAMPHMKDATPRLTRRQSAILGAFTGISCGPFEAVHEYAEKKLGRPVWTHEFASKERVAELKEAAREDFLSICYENEDTPHLKETHHE